MVRPSARNGRAGMDVNSRSLRTESDSSLSEKSGGKRIEGCEKKERK